MYYSYKNILFISTKSCQISAVTAIVNAISLADCTFKHICITNNFNNYELEKIKDELSENEYHLIIGLGGGKCCDVCKYFASLQNLAYVFSPTISSSLAYFVPYCINPFDSTKNFFAKSPAKIYICETDIKELDEKTYKYCLANFASYICVLFDFVIVNNLECEQKTEKINKIFSRLKSEISQNDLAENNLILMDLLIDLGYELQDVDFEKLSLVNMYSLQLKIENNYAKFNNNLPFCADILCEIFCRLIGKNIDERVEIYNIINLVKIIKKYKINIKKVKNVKKIAENCNFLVKNNQFLQKQNNFREGFNKIKIEFKSILNLIYHGQKCDNQLNFDTYLMAVNMLPVVYNTNYILSNAFFKGQINFA